MAQIVSTKAVQFYMGLVEDKLRKLNAIIPKDNKITSNIKNPTIIINILITVVNSLSNFEISL